MSADDHQLPQRRRNGRLRIPLPFGEALKAAVEAKPPEKKWRKPRQKKRATS